MKRIKQLLRTALGLTWHDAEIAVVRQDIKNATEACNELVTSAYAGLITSQELALKLPGRIALRELKQERLNFLLAAKEAWRNTLLMLAACTFAISVIAAFN